MKKDIPQLGTKEFNDLASTYFGGKPKQEKMETSIEFLIGDLFEKGLLKLNGDTLKSVGIAKEMFEKQIEEAWFDGWIERSETSKQYYNETFKQQEQ